MKALFINSFGGLEVLQYGELPDPILQSGQVLVNVKAVSVASNMKPNQENFATIETLVSTGLLIPLIEQVFLLPRGAEAFKLVEQGNVRGKVVRKL